MTFRETVKDTGALMPQMELRNRLLRKLFRKSNIWEASEEELETVPVE